MNGPPDLSDEFFVAWLDMCARLKVDPIDLIRVSYSESGCRASAHNPGGHASGLIQFMPDTLVGLGWTKGHDAFRQLSATEQVPFVERYMRPHVAWARSDALCYVAVFLPALGPKAYEMGPQYVLCGQRGPLAWAYGANKVLDRDKDGTITVADLGRQLDGQCSGSRWDAILWRLREAMGLQPPAVPEAPVTEPELAVTYDLTQSSIPPPSPAPDGSYAAALMKLADLAREGIPTTATKPTIYPGPKRDPDDAA